MAGEQEPYGHQRQDNFETILYGEVTELTDFVLSKQNDKKVIVMHSAGKRAWKKKLEEDSTTTAAMNRNVKTLPSGVHVAGGISTGPSKKKANHPTQSTAMDIPTAQNVAFEGLNGAECRKWWQETPDNHLVKASIQKAQVERVIQMPIFCIRDYEGLLHIMIEMYDRFS